MATTDAITVFYSYAHEDEKLRDELDKHLRVLERQGVIASWHDRKISVGKEWDKLIDERLETARIILLLVSPDFIASDYCYDNEMTQALERHDTGEARVIPVILRPCLWDAAPFAKLQAAPTDGNPVTKWPNKDAAFEDIARKIKAVAEEWASSKLVNKTIATSATRAVWNLPRRNRHFTGRENFLAELYHRLTVGQAAVTQPIAIIAVDGIGKTELALEYIYRHKDRYDVAWWLRANNPANLLADLNMLASALNLRERDAQGPESVIVAVQRWLAENSRWLLVFDSAVRPSELELFLPKRVLGHVLITSSTLTWGRLATRLPLDLWLRKESAEFLLKRIYDADSSAADRLAEALGDLPLALEQAAAYIEQSGISLAGYADILEQDYGFILRGSASDLNRRVAATCEMSLAQLTSESRSAAQLLNLCAFLAPYGIPLEAIRTGRKSLPEPLRTAASDPREFTETLAALLHYSLARRDGKSLSVHPLTQSAIRDHLNDDAKTWAHIAARLCETASATKNQHILSARGTTTESSLQLDGDMVALITQKPLDNKKYGFFRGREGGDDKMSPFGAFSFAFITALFLYSLLLLLHAIGYLTKTEDVGADLFMYVFKQGLISKKSDYLYAFVDVDEATYSKWGEPLLMPRDKLLCIINFARTSQAKLIFVDFDLSHWQQDAEFGAVFARSLARMSEDGPCSVLPGHSVTAASASTVPIILHRGISHYHVSPTSDIGRLRLSDSKLENAVSESDYLFWASTTLEIDPDGIVRRWILWKETCREAGENESVEVIPSVALMSQAVLKGDNPERIANAIKSSCARFSCTDKSRHESCPKPEIGGRRIDLSNKKARILYTIPWIPIQDKTLVGHERSFEDLRPPEVEHKGRKEPIVVSIRADAVTQLYCPNGSKKQIANRCMPAPFGHERSDRQVSAHGEMASSPLLKDRIVIIGGSYSSTRDTYVTPVREAMPGAVALMNSIHTLTHHGVLHAPGWFISSILFFVQAGVVAAVYCFLGKPLYAAIAYVLLFCIMFVVNGLLLKSGVWIDASLATLGVFMYESTSNLVEKVMRFGMNVWNSITASSNSVLWMTITTVISILPEPVLAEAVGYVEFFNKPSTEYAIRPLGKKKRSVHHFARVYAHDQIVVNSPDDDAFINLRLLNGQALSIRRLNSPYKVSGSVKSSIAIDFLLSIGKALTPWWDNNPTFRDAVSRGKRAPADESGPLSVDILDHHHLALVEGVRDFTLAWSGGTGPFKVKLDRVSQLTPVFEREDLSERRLPPERVTLTQGQYRIKVHDSGSSASVNRMFKVVSKAELKPLPADARMVDLPLVARRTHHALWLASQDDGRWALESFLQIDDLAGTYKLAGILHSMLAQGSLPLPQ